MNLLEHFYAALFLCLSKSLFLLLTMSITLTTRLNDRYLWLRDTMCEVLGRLLVNKCQYRLRVVVCMMRSVRLVPHHDLVVQHRVDKRLLLRSKRRL